MPQRSDEPTLIDRPLERDESPASDTLRNAQLAPLESTPIASELPPPSLPPHEGSAASLSQSLTQTLAIKDEHAARGRGMVWLGVLGSALMAIAMQVPERRPPGHWLATVVLAIVAAVSTATLVSSRGRGGVESSKVFGLGVLTAASILVVTFYAGPFSPAPLALFLGVYYFGLGDSRLQSWVMFLVCTGGYFVLGVAATLELFALDQSLLPLADTTLSLRAVATLVVTSFLCLTFWLARVSRAATLRAMSQLETARRQIRQREALLDEARADLNQVLDAGRVGRFSGRQLGPFLLDELLGRGAMGEVYAALDSQSSAPLAVKLLHPHVLDEPSHVERFFREADVAGALDSPNIVRVLSTGFAEDGSPYIAMERLHGHDLAWHLRERRRLKLADVLELVTEVAQALANAQDAAIVHRDLKPQNLFLHEAGGVRLWKVLDFGVSKIASASSSLTGGAAVGTPSYMSPEQARGHDVDHRADVFALGVIAYRCITGRPAFTGADPLTTMYNVVHMQPARPSEHVPVHEDIELTIALVLAKKRERRFPSAMTFAAALRDATRGQLDERWRRDARALIEEHPWGMDEAELRAEAASQARKAGTSRKSQHRISEHGS